MLPRQPSVRTTPYASHAGPTLGNGHRIPPHGSSHGGAYPVGRHMSVAVGIDDDCPGVKSGHPRVLGDIGGNSWDAVPSGRSAHLRHLDHAGAHQDQGQALRVRETCERPRAREPIAPGNINGGRLSVVPPAQPTAAPFQPLVPNAGQHGQVSHVAHERQANELLRSRTGPEPVYVQQTRGNFRGPSSTHQLQPPEHPMLADQNRHQPPHLEPSSGAPHHVPLPRYTCALPLQHRPRGMPSFVPVYSSYEEALEQQQKQQRQRRLQQQHVQVQNQHGEQKHEARHGHPQPPRPHQVPHPHDPTPINNSFKPRLMDNTMPLPDRVYPARRESGAQERLVGVAPRQDYGRQTYPPHGQRADDGPRHVVRQDRVLSRSHSLPGDGSQSAPPISHDSRPSVTPHQVGPPKSSVRPQSLSSEAGATRVNPSVLYPCPPDRVAPRSEGSTPRDSAPQVQVKRNVRRAMDSQTWNPYRCVSPADDPLHRQGTFDRAQGDRREETGVSMPRRRSPLKHEKSRHQPPERGPKNTADEDLVQASSSVEHSTLGDLLERGFDNVDRPRVPSKMLPSESPCPSGSKNNIEQEAPPKTPARSRSNRSIYAYEGDKENSELGVGSIGQGKRPVGCRAEETLSGRKRGGEQIAKQKSFTGSYFQVSPRSFLQPNKRRRAVA